MAKRKNTFFNRISQSNIVSDAMLKEVNYGDYALMMALKDKPQKVMSELDSDYTKELR
ncbi:hypothetical protein [Sporosalibacterium faouarense]|uniref:hypothetical protein n=1 Tax=Sporosalibacterium faouarense TaxID=516123 RepID=UPI00192B4F03|nr:hypothetical protein [Sporosalibacterium faouarense]